MDFEDDKSVVLSESEIVSVKGGDSDVEDGLSEVSVDDLEGGEGSEFDEYDEFDDEEAVEYNRKKGGTEINLEEKQYNSDEEEDSEEEDEDYLQKLDDHFRQKVIENHHPELKTLNYEEIETLATVVRDADSTIIDPLHRTLPVLTRYEKARILGERAKQINMGAKPFVEVDESMIDGYLIALKELENKLIPFIIQRPLPNGGSEYWRISDLEVLT
jgi:DNA-directed RNA polymerase I, II, and III subunit RPABC2